MTKPNLKVRDLEARPRTEMSEEDPVKGLFDPVTFDVYYQPDYTEQTRARPGFVPAEPIRIGSFTFAPMPSCCGVVVSTGSYILPEYRDYRAYRFHDLKEHVARELGYSCMLATTHTSNFPEVIGAAKHGWKMHPAFINKRTGNQLTVMEKHL